MYLLLVFRVCQLRANAMPYDAATGVICNPGVPEQFKSSLTTSQLFERASFANLEICNVVGPSVELVAVFQRERLFAPAVHAQAS